MGRRGPPRKPTNLKIVQGNPGDHALSKSEPKPEVVKNPKPPKWLTAEARKIWRTEYEKLHALGLLTIVDTTLFAMYCDAVAQMMKLQKFIAEHGLFYPIFFPQTAEEIKNKEKPKLKYMVQYPQVSEHHHYRKEVLRLSQEFGMSPASRVGLSVDPKNLEEDVDKFLFG